MKDEPVIDPAPAPPDWTRHEARSLPMALLRARESVMQYFRPLHRKGQSTEQQWRILRVLFSEGEMTATELARRSFLLAPSVSRILQDLEASGFVQRQSSDGDRRQTLLRLTSFGVQRVNGAFPKLEPVHREIRRRFGEERTDRLLELLEELQQVLGEPMSGKGMSEPKSKKETRNEENTD